jgi:hypothetical protein
MFSDSGVSVERCRGVIPHQSPIRIKARVAGKAACP